MRDCETGKPDASRRFPFLPLGCGPAWVNWDRAVQLAVTVLFEQSRTLRLGIQICPCFQPPELAATSCTSSASWSSQLGHKPCEAFFDHLAEVRKFPSMVPWCTPRPPFLWRRERQRGISYAALPVFAVKLTQTSAKISQTQCLRARCAGGLR